MKTLSYTILFLSFAMGAQSQQHLFLEPVFDEVKVTYDQVYGENATVLYLGPLGEAIKESLLYDLYEPNGDGCPERPLIIYFHSGNFLPTCLNQTTVGTKRDSSVVEICKRFARTGYVVASVNYRLGWNPLASPEIFATAGLINAAYRGVQDANTSIRYFKKTVVEEGNPLRIDTSSIILMGDDSGGYLSLHAACLDSYDKILNTTDNQFLIPTGNPDFPYLPMIIEGLNGDVEGLHFGVMDTILYPFDLPYPHGDTLCYPNHTGYSSDFSVAVSMGSAVADTAWIDPGQPAMICVHVPYDITTPYEQGFVYVAGQRVIKVYGSYRVVETANRLGNNDCLFPPDDRTDFQKAVSAVASSRNDGLEGLLPIYGDTITDSTPWVFWDPSTHPCSDLGFVNNPHMTRMKAETYIDTILAYVLPRIYPVLKKMDNSCIVSTGDLVMEQEFDIVAFPNPAMQEVFVSTSENYPIQELSVYDMSGKIVLKHTDINYNYFHLPVDKLIPGQYILNFQFKHDMAARQIIVK